jgi:membrane protease YdiL (CAAX protease family)
LGPRFVKQAAVCYGALLVAAAVWNGLRGRELAPPGDSVPISIILGILAAAVTVSAGLLTYRAIPALRRLADELSPVLVDGSSRSDLVLLAVFSGIGEEVFFRGAVQPEFGIVAASLAFGVLHIGPDRRFLIWTAWAVAAGFLFGALFTFTGGVLAPIVAHTLHNGATFLIWKRARGPKPS